MSLYSENRKEQKRFYSSKEWKTCRDAYRKKAKGLCEKCLAKGIIKQGDHVHHKIELTLENMNNPTIAYDFNNLELLCFECHMAEHDHFGEYQRKRSKKRFVVDKNTGKVYTKGD